MNKSKYTNWRLETDAEKILWLYFDRHASAVNSLDLASFEEFADIINNLANDHEHKGLIIASGKNNGFIAGADITQFNRFKDIDESVQLLQRGHEILRKLEALTMPTVAMIEGFCLGGGLELALACRYRVAEDGIKTKLGLPEVKLGIHPGWGGTVRLPRLIGGRAALDLILSGHPINAKKAESLGFVDAAVPKRHLINAARYFILQKPPRHQPTILQALSNTSLFRKVIGYYARYKLKEKISPFHYPAPFAVIDLWVRFGVSDEALDREARSCGKFFFSEASRNLVRVFFLQERLKNLAKESREEFLHVHVIGAGTMGGDIAAWCALQGLKVTLQDREPRLIAPAIQRGYQLMNEKLKEPHLVQRAMDLIMADIEGLGLEQADVIIEAIFEDLDIKRELWKTIEMRAKPTAILATNTSSIPLDEINTVLQNPERLVGLHFFNPVAKMPLVEIVQGAKTSPEVIAKALSFTRKLDRLPLPVKSSPGFLVNRVLTPYLLEAVQLLEEGIPATTIDEAMLEFGMPMGPIALADTVGLDVCLSVAKNLAQHFGSAVPQRLVRMVEQKKLGRKTGEGFYSYKNGKPNASQPVSASKNNPAIAERLISRLLKESFSCLREGVVADSDLLDAGMIFGTGFAPFLGGPMAYAKTCGITELSQDAPAKPPLKRHGKKAKVHGE